MEEILEAKEKKKIIEPKREEKKSLGCRLNNWKKKT